MVLAELDGTGVLLCYLLVAVDGQNQMSRSADAGATTDILGQFLQPLKNANFEPLFFIVIRIKRRLLQLGRYGRK